MADSINYWDVAKEDEGKYNSNFQNNNVSATL